MRVGCHVTRSTVEASGAARHGSQLNPSYGTRRRVVEMSSFFVPER